MTDTDVEQRPAEDHAPAASPRLLHLCCPRCYPDDSQPATSLCRRLTAIPNDAELGRPPCVVCDELGQLPCEVCGFSPWGLQ